jgi:malate permease and related proteins
MNQMLVSLLPVFILLGTGVLIRKFSILSGEAIDGLKTIIIKIALPSALFLAFAQADMGIENFWIFLLVFLLCAVLYIIGGLLHTALPGLFPDEYTNGYFTGFEFGMIGIGLFTAIWGMERLPTIAMIAFGHEVFIWFVYAPILTSRKTGSIKIDRILKDFFRTPTTIAIFLGFLMNVLHVFPEISSVIAGQALIHSLEMISGVLAPLILFIIGYSISFKKIPLKKSLVLILSRWFFVLILGFGLLHLIKIFLSVDKFFQLAFYAFILLPPPFILPLYMKEDRPAEISFYSELLIYYTLISFAGYVVLMSVI